MEKIASFRVNHLNLFPGLYLSRKDYSGKTAVSTFDLRITAPNREPAMDASAMHTIEHLGATFLRNSKLKDDVVYFGPMGCQTGFYAVFFGDLVPENVFSLILEMCDYIISFEGEIPGAKPEECGNFSFQNLKKAKEYISRYKNDLIKNKRTVYPD